MLILILVLWSIIGIILAYALYNDDILVDDMSTKKALFIAVICGPITAAAFLIGTIYGLIVRFLDFFD